MEPLMAQSAAAVVVFVVGAVFGVKMWPKVVAAFNEAKAKVKAKL